MLSPAGGLGCNFSLYLAGFCCLPAFYCEIIFIFNLVVVVVVVVVLASTGAVCICGSMFKEKSSCSLGTAPQPALNSLSAPVIPAPDPQGHTSWLGRSWSLCPHTGGRARGWGSGVSVGGGQGEGWAPLAPPQCQEAGRLPPCVTWGHSPPQ